MEEIKKIYGYLKVKYRGEDAPSHSELKEMTKKFFQLSNIEPNDKLIEQVVMMYEENIAIKAFEPDILVDNGIESNWLKIKKEEPDRKLKYWERYVDFLSSEDFDENTIRIMETSTEEILGYCSNPTPNIDESNNNKRRGLIVGDVQSGKTANYLALINLACDYDYKLFVVLAGLTDSLRKQTQNRIDFGLIGAISNTIGSEKIQYVGVGESSNDHYAVSLTNTEKDFNKIIQENNNATILDYSKPVILVVKKNKSTLQNIISRLKPGSHGIKDHIMIIDDEADNASINTKNQEEDPSTINNLIRQLYNNFPIATYIGYTATPFANVFIDPNDEECYKDLFPSDFIIMLNTPDSYFGAKKIFGLNNGGQTRFIKVLDESEKNFLQVNHKKDDVFCNLPQSLKDAILCFLINCVIRTKRGKPSCHRSMMINISRFNKMQAKIRDKVCEYVNDLKNIVSQSSFMSKEKFLRNKEMHRMYTIYMTDPYYNDLRNNYSWVEIQESLMYETDKLKIVVVNRNKDEDKLDYEQYKEIGARYIVIGGFVLSRGLTLEGLMVSYYSRNGSAYDTLLQMCRWFGYRKDYEDLCRIYMSQININSFIAAIDATNDLKTQFRKMKDLGKTPNEFGLMVKKSPEILNTLLITSRNKMRNAVDKTLVINFSATVVDTSKLYWSTETNNKNVELVMDYLAKPLGNLNIVNDRFMYLDVDKQKIVYIIRRISIPIENKKFDTLSIADFIENSNILNKWDVVIATGKQNSEKWSFSGQAINMVKRTFYLRKDENNNYEKFIYVSHHSNRLLDPGILDSNLDPKIVSQIRKKDNPTAEDYLNMRTKPLFIIYPILLEMPELKNGSEFYEKYFEIKNTFSNKNPLFGFALAFPNNGQRLEIKYKFNIRKQEEYEKERESLEDDDEI